MPLLGRQPEIEVLDRVLAAVHGGRSAVLVVRGEPGVGKTALLEHAISSASGFRVARAVGIESEMELPFAALQQLCAPMLDRLGRLPGPQREALEVAFGLNAGRAPDRFLVGLAVLTLLSDVAEEQPLLCVVDDAQWLDRASTHALAFVARRLLAESLGLVFASRNPSGEIRGLPELMVEGLRDVDARALLCSVIHWPWDERVRDQFVAETDGNPLALLELSRGLRPADLAGGFGMPVAPALPRRIEESFRRRIEALPAETQRLLLLAAAEPIGDPTLLWRAARRLGIGFEAAADTDGLLTIGASVTFRHPLVRSALYRAASPHERRAVHRALGEATNPDADPDRRAWHLAEATPGFDVDVASELERSAGRAQARGGLAAAAAFLERAAVLTVDPARRAERALAAAEAKCQAGAFDAALRLVGMAETGPLDELQCARVDLLRGQIAFAMTRGRDAPRLLLKAAKRLEPLDRSLARETYLEALSSVSIAGRLASGGGVLEIARAARSAPPSSRPPRATDLLLDGLALVITDGHEAGSPTLRRAVDAFRREPREEELQWLWLASKAAALLWDDEAWDVLSAQFVQLARDAGALTLLPWALATRSGLLIFSGEFAVAASLIEEVAAVNDAAGRSIAPYAALSLVAFQGREAEALRLIEAGTREVVRRGEGQGLTFIHFATALLNNGLGRYADALAAAQQAAEDLHDLRFSTLGLVELIEAGARSGNPDVAADALARLSLTTTASRTDWALGVEARSRALLTDGKDAETLFRRAIQALEQTSMRVDCARARLLYGEWLRRERRRLDAREQLRSAHELFEEFGMTGFAERARIELRATGERARIRTPATRDDLTPQETQIARLAAEGATNRVIAAQLFISPSTVDYHLRKAYRKLGVKSRTQLAARASAVGRRGLPEADLLEG